MEVSEGWRGGCFGEDYKFSVGEGGGGGGVCCVMEATGKGFKALEVKYNFLEKDDCWRG